MSFSADFDALCKEHETEVLFFFSYKEIKTEYTYRGTLELIKKCVLYLRSIGLQEGDRLITIIQNSPEQVILFLACLYGGFGYAPLPAEATQQDLDRWNSIVHAKLTFIGIDSSLIGSKLVHMTANGDFSWLEGISQAEISGDDIRESKLYVSTSGSTGEPKAIQVDGETLWRAAKAFCGEYDLLGRKCRFWNYLSMAYMGGFLNLTLIPIASCGSFLLTHKFTGGDYLSFWNTVKDYNIDCLWFTPTIIKGLLVITERFGNRYKDYCRHNMKICFTGMAPITKKLKEQMEKEMSFAIFENLGLSETTFIIGEKKEDSLYREDSCIGQPYSYARCKYCEISEHSGVYELWVKTPYLFDGYLSNEGTVMLETDDEGFFNTKDIVRLKNERIILSGRNKDVIKKGGEMIVLSEIEVFVKRLDLVEDVIAVSIPDDYYGENYALCVIPKESDTDKQSLTDDLLMKMKGSLRRSMLPYKIAILDHFPITDSGKVKKVELKKIIKERFSFSN